MVSLTVTGVAAWVIWQTVCWSYTSSTGGVRPVDNTVTPSHCDYSSVFVRNPVTKGRFFASEHSVHQLLSYYDVPCYTVTH